MFYAKVKVSRRNDSTTNRPVPTFRTTASFTALQTTKHPTRVRIYAWQKNLSSLRVSPLLVATRKYGSFPPSTNNTLLDNMLQHAIINFEKYSRRWCEWPPGLGGHDPGHEGSQHIGRTRDDTREHTYFIQSWPLEQKHLHASQFATFRTCIENFPEKKKIIIILFDATSGCVRWIKRTEKVRSGPICLYESVVSIHTFTVISMLFERHDTLSMISWLNSELRCGVKAPKVVISDQSLVLMSALAQKFTQYKSLEQYLQACFSIVVLQKEEKLPTCFIRNDVNHFIHLIS